jgi:tetratricopeptide (TPR) repeat protein
LHALRGFSALCSHSTPPGELPPPPPRACFGRDELVEEIVGLAESLRPIALIGPGGIGKTSVALAVLHNNRIKERFGDNRRFVRCDQFSASRVNFLNRLSKVIGAGVENSEDLTPLRPCLSSKEMLIILDNAESILDPQGTDGHEIYGLVEELSQLGNVCLCITSRITTVPPHCKRLGIPTLSMEAAHSAFYSIYDNDEQSGRINEVLKQLDFHPLSVTLLAMVAHQNEWDNNRLVEEWGRHQTGMLWTEHSKSLAVTIELSLGSPMFQQLGPDARGLLGVVAFFPQGIDEKNLDWLFPTISNKKTTFDKFCILSLTYRTNGFITMLAPLRDHLYPKDPKASTLLSAIKDLYLTRLWVYVDPDDPKFGDTRWIISEDVNVEHLLNVFVSADPNSENIWKGCNDFMGHLQWHKPRKTILGPKIEQLPDDHPRKPNGLFELSKLFERAGNSGEEKRLLIHALKLWRERRGSDYWIAHALQRLAGANWLLGHLEEGIQQAKEASGIFERLGDTKEQAASLGLLGQIFVDDDQLKAAAEATVHSINLLGKGQEYQLCVSHRILGTIFLSNREREKAARHYNISLRIAEAFGWPDMLFWSHYALELMFRSKDELDDAHAQIKRAKEHAGNNKYLLGRAMEEHARIWYRQGRHEEAASEVMCAIEIYGKLEAAGDLERSGTLLQQIKQSMKQP